MTISCPRSMATLVFYGFYADDPVSQESRIEELREQLISLNDQSLNIQNAADNDNRELTAEEADRVADIFDQFTAIETDIIRREQIVAQSRALSTPRGRQTEPDPPGAGITSKGAANVSSLTGRRPFRLGAVYRL